MKERPILFSGPMVRALLDGSKTQTRRIVKNQPPADVSPIRVAHYHPTVITRTGDEEPGAEIFGAYSDDGEWGSKCPYGEPGDRLWVRETWQGPMWEEGTWDPDTDYHKPEFCEYRADGGPIPEYVDFEDNLHQGWKPSIHMPRWASRITLEITGVRVERLQSISEADAAAEGVESLRNEGEYWKDYLRSTERCDELICINARDSFRTLWDRINGDGAWAANPWVWVVEFKRI
ncbi:hypothetical protein [Paraburkholderia diazotrophica]|uniref:Morphogenetic protein n=1 Tax=Paraburkholderia diazotrophica TaxID=667676 RepID=A0A1H6QS30_9BURK|nr:hypothetical protein [Paraburkholderia diazotrophica]SEI41792.1 hypothetical protein SAMN05192539_1001277 [Paraburkholderia diazotrophica]